MQRVHSQTTWLFFFFSSCFLLHFVRSPVLCHFDPEGGCALTCDTLMLQFMFQIEWSIHHMLTAHSNQSFPITWDLLRAFKPNKRRHKNDLKPSPRWYIQMWMALRSACQRPRAKHVQQMCVQSLSHSKRRGLHLSHYKYVNTRQTHCFPSPPNRIVRG